MKELPNISRHPISSSVNTAALKVPTTISKSIIINLAKQFSLNFVNDATNDDLNYHRNYIRKKIIPPIKKIWPELNQVMHHNILLQDCFCHNLLQDILM